MPGARSKRIRATRMWTGNRRDRPAHLRNRPEDPGSWQTDLCVRTAVPPSRTSRNCRRPKRRAHGPDDPCGRKRARRSWTVAFHARPTGNGGGNVSYDGGHDRDSRGYVRFDVCHVCGLFDSEQTAAFLLATLEQPRLSSPTMRNLGPQRRKSDDPRGALTGHRCKICREDLRLVRRHVSPLRLGAPVTTEFYQCRACDSGYKLNPGTGAWKPWVADES